MLWRSSLLASPLEYADTKKGPASPLESAVTKLLDLKSLRMNRYRKMAGGRSKKERRRQGASSRQEMARLPQPEPQGLTPLGCALGRIGGVVETGGNLWPGSTPSHQTRPQDNSRASTRMPNSAPRAPLTDSRSRSITHPC